VLAFCLLAAGALSLSVVDPEAPDGALAVIVHALGVGLPIGLGAFRLARRRDDRFALLLIAAGLLFALTILALSGDGTLYSVGRVSAWLVDVMLVYLLLSFPTGRLTGNPERRLFMASVLLVAVLYLPTALVADYPQPSPWGTCGTDCPSNAFGLMDGEPAFVSDVVRPLREVLTVLLFGGVALVLIRRTRRASALMRQALRPVAAVALVRAVTMPTYLITRAVGETSATADVLGWVYVLTLPLVTVCFGAGLLSQRLFVASALERLTFGLEQHANASALRAALAKALEDDSLRIDYWVRGDPGRWVDETGWPTKKPAAPSRRAVTEVTSDGRRLAAITHDAALDPALVHAASSYALGALENERLVGQLQTSLGELAESRGRIVAEADRERRRIERDLHDGAQQRLVALRIKLGMVAERLDVESPEVADAVRGLERDIDVTIDEVRSFARGVYPPLLAERGLGEALRAAGRSAQLPTTVDVKAIGRFRPEIEATVYFACVEGLQNVAKHARGASNVAIAVSHNPHLRFEVRDDGEGFDVETVARGAGLTNLRDRLEAVGGELRVESAPGSGTTIHGSIPAA
jgi:signal transduction histidine kinase